jgi:hypothetical protein
MVSHARLTACCGGLALAACATGAAGRIALAPVAAPESIEHVSPSVRQDAALDCVLAGEQSPSTSTLAADRLRWESLEESPRARALAVLAGPARNDANLRWLLTRALEGTRTEDVFGAAVARLRDDSLDPWSRRAAAASLLTAPRGLEILAEVVRDPAVDRSVARGVVVEMATRLRALPDEWATRNLLRELATDATLRPLVRAESARSLGDVPADRPLLARLADDGDVPPLVRVACIDRLAATPSVEGAEWIDPSRLEQHLRQDVSREFRWGLALWVRSRDRSPGDESLRAEVDALLASDEMLAWTQDRPLGR